MNKTYWWVTEEGMNKAIKAGLIDLAAISHIFDGLDKIHAPNTFGRIYTIQYLLSIQSSDTEHLIDSMFALDEGTILAKSEQIEWLNHSITEALLGSWACQTIWSYQSQKLFVDKINTLCTPYRLKLITSLHENVFENIYFYFQVQTEKSADPVEYKLWIRSCRYFDTKWPMSTYYYICAESSQSSVKLRLPECGRLELLCTEFKKALDQLANGYNI